MQNYLLSCDWGTSSFRLSLYDIRTKAVLGQVTSQDGIGRIYREWLLKGSEDSETRLKFFKDTLNKNISRLAEDTGKGLDHFPVVISGMASSSIGLADLPYASLPFPLDGSAAVVTHFSEDEAFLHEIVLISGVRSDTDVMRGEETQIIGICASLQDPVGEALFIFPGTHSKHIYVKEGRITAFKTFMTGEMFEVISRETILRDSITGSPEHRNDGEDVAAFTTGVMYAKSTNLLNSLFTVRTNQLFDRMSAAENFQYLSGLLIGSELADMAHSAPKQLILCGGKHLHQLYERAIRALGLEKNAIVVAPAIVEGAAMTAHRIIFENRN